MKRILLVGSGDSIEDVYKYDGIDVVAYRAIRFEPTSFELDCDDNFDWIFFGSKRGAAVVLELEPDVLDRLKVGAVGSRTAAFLAANGVRCLFVPETFSSRHWPGEFVQKFPGASGVLYPTSDRSPIRCPAVFREHGIQFRKIVVYRTRCDSRLISDIPDVFVFTSPSCYDCFVEVHGRDMFQDRRVVAIGDVTRQHIETERIRCEMPDRFTVRDAMDYAAAMLKS